LKSETETPARLKGFVLLYSLTALALIAVAGVLGLLMRFSQAGWLSLRPAMFYQLLTVHGLGMVVAALAGAMAMSWWLLSKLPGGRPSYAWLSVIYGVLVLGVVGVIVATLIGRVGTGWTMLLPLPISRYSAGQWSAWASELFLDSAILVGVALLLFFGLVLWQVRRTAGSLAAGLGWGIISGKGQSVPAYVIPLTVSSLTGLLTTLLGAVYLVLMHLEATFPDAIIVNRLLAKNLLYAFGHTIINISIYYAAAAVYVILPTYTKREWKASRLLAASWNVSLVMVLLAFFHHIYMDFAQPPGLHIIGQIASFGVALPPALVTIFGALGYVYRSRMVWVPVPTFIFLGLLGWMVGGAAAGLDGVIAFNFQLHNTLWVPAHFHTYLLLGVVLFFLAFVAHTLPEIRGVALGTRSGRWSLGLVFVGGVGQLATWYLSGLAGGPRRYAVLPEGLETYSVIASVSIVVVGLGLLVYLLSLAKALLRRPR